MVLFTLITRAESKGLAGSVKAPPSKSYTHRAVFMASLSEGCSKIRNALISSDTIATVNSCLSFGATINRRGRDLEIFGTSIPKSPEDVIDALNSGTTLRIVTSILGCTRNGYAIVTGDASLRKRPMLPLLEALGKLGVKAWSARENGCAPIIVRGEGMEGGKTEIDASISSQFVSSLLISSPLARKKVLIKVKNPVSKPYIDSTSWLMERFGIKVERKEYEFFSIDPQRYKNYDFTIPADMSSVSFLMAACAIAGGEITIKGIEKEIPQADFSFIDILCKLGVEVKLVGKNLITKHDGSKLRGCKVKLTDSPDLLPVVSILALKSNSDIEIEGVGHTKYKETNRISMLASELSKTGARIEASDDRLKIQPTKEIKKAVLDPHGDHRLFMAFYVATLASRELYVYGPDISYISYPRFLSDMAKLGIRSVKQEI